MIVYTPPTRRPSWPTCAGPRGREGDPEKISRGLLCQGDALDPVAGFEFIEANRAVHAAATMCRLLGVSTSGYYCWRDRPPSARALSDEVLTEKIRLIHTQSRQTYGYRRVRTELVEEHDEAVGPHRVARLMKQANIQGVTRRKFCRTPRRDDRARPAPDLLERDFSALRPDARWVADITYVPTWAGFLFFAVVLDVFTRKVVGWSMSANQNTELVTRALQMAVARRRPSGVVVHHSDQGCQGGFNWTSQHLDSGGVRCATRTDRRRFAFTGGRSLRPDGPVWLGVRIGSDSGRESLAA